MKSEKQERLSKGESEEKSVADRFESNSSELTRPKPSPAPEKSLIEDIFEETRKAIRENRMMTIKVIGVRI